MMKKCMLLQAICLCCVMTVMAQEVEKKLWKPEFGLELNSELQVLSYDAGGDASTKYNYVNLLRLNASMLVAKGLSFHIASISTCMTSEENIAGDLQTFSNIEAGNIPFVLSACALTWDIPAAANGRNRHSLSFGVRNMNLDYFASELTSLYGNSSCGIYPTISVNHDIANYPLASVGAHYRYERLLGKADTDEPNVLALQASLYNGLGYNRFTGRDNVFRFCPQSDGLFGLARVEYQHDGSSYFLGVCGRKTFGGVESSSPTIWSYAEQRLTEHGSLIAGYSHAFGSGRECRDFVGIGGKYSWRRCELGIFTDYAHFSECGESATELTCRIQLTPHLTLQPMAHLIVPVSPTPDVEDDTRIVGVLRMTVSY